MFDDKNKQIDEIKQAAFEFAKSEDGVIPKLRHDSDRLLFLQMVNIYSLYINKIISKSKAAILTADAVKDFGLNEFHRSIYEESLHNYQKCNNLMVKMNKEPSVETEIIYELLPPLKLNKEKIENVLLREVKNE